MRAEIALSSCLLLPSHSQIRDKYETIILKRPVHNAMSSSVILRFQGRDKSCDDA
jgi:hypothetical protein